MTAAMKPGPLASQGAPARQRLPGGGGVTSAARRARSVLTCPPATGESIRRGSARPGTGRAPSAQPRAASRPAPVEGAERVAVALETIESISLLLLTAGKVESGR